MKEDHELVKRIFQAQKDDPKRGDWWLQVKEDMQKYNIDEDVLKTNTKCQAKKYIKEQIHSKAFENLQAVQKTHSKVKDMKYAEYKMQNYLKNSEMNYEEATLLFALRSQTVKDIKLNTKTFSQNDKMCPLCLKFEDTQKHCIECPKLKSVRDQFKDDIKYDHIFSNCELEQKAVASLFFSILETRQRLIQEGLPGT